MIFIAKSSFVSFLRTRYTTLSKVSLLVQYVSSRGRQTHPNAPLLISLRISKSAYDGARCCE
jgi:hypothetical protein